MPLRHRRNSTSAAHHLAALGLAVPGVVTHRLMRLWLAGPRPSQRDRDEFHRMGAEKLAAFHESWNAMFLETYRASLGLAFSPVWWSWLAGRPRLPTRRMRSRSQRAALTILGRGLGPVERRATANAKRLRRVRL